MEGHDSGHHAWNGRETYGRPTGGICRNRPDGGFSAHRPPCEHNDTETLPELRTQAVRRHRGRDRNDRGSFDEVPGEEIAGRGDSAS